MFANNVDESSRLSPAVRCDQRPISERCIKYLVVYYLRTNERTQRRKARLSVCITVWCATHLEQRAGGQAVRQRGGGQRGVAARGEARQTRQRGGGAQAGVAERAQVRHVQRRQRAAAAAHRRHALVAHACRGTRYTTGLC